MYIQGISFPCEAIANSSIEYWRAGLSNAEAFLKP